VRLGVAALVLVSLPGISRAALFAGLPTNGPGPFGGAFPIGEAPVRLAGEETAIRVEGDATHFRVEARYRFSASAAGSIRFGVPLNGTGDDTLARTIRLAVDGGADVGCDVQPAAVPEGGPLFPSAWCTATLAVSQGDNHLLVLRYRGELDYQDGGFIGSAHALARHLGYPLSAAGYWAGAPAPARVTLDLSAAPGVEVRAQPAPRSSSPVLAWTFAGDEAQVRQLDVSFSLRWTFAFEVRGSAFSASARASSVLEPAAAFAAGNVLDANPLTAWCGSGKDPWVKIDIPPPSEDGLICGVERVAVLLGAGAPSHRRAGRRPTKIRLSICGDDRPIDEARLGAAPRDGRTEVVTLDVPRNAPIALGTCLRITLVSPAGPSCISEIVPAISCGTML
jgi:hypothetical protein